MSKRLEAVIELWSIDDFKAWNVSKSAPAYIRLSKSTALEDAGNIVAEIAAYNHINADKKANEIVEEIINQECLIVSGGLRAVDDEKEINPGCCCGLETWNEWLEISPEKIEIWLGHDPAPYVEFLHDEQVYIIHSDGGLFNIDEKVTCIDFSVNELKEALENISQDLQDFAIILKSWADKNFPNQSEKLVETFKTNFHIE